MISKFLDSHNIQESPFSIHNITEQGLECFHKIAGDWYGTNSISQVINQINKKNRPYEDFEICIFNDGVIFKKDIIEAGANIVHKKADQQ